MSTKLGEILVRENLITSQQLREALEYQRTNGGRLGSNLVKLGICSDDVVTAVLSRQCGVSSINLELFHIEQDVMLSVPALDRVKTRYGRALDESVPLAGDALDLPGGYRLRRLSYHAIVDAEGRDYLVWERPGAEPLAAIATMVTAALRYLVLRLSGDPPQEPESDGT